ncbi:hypothetical protein ACWKWJ_13350 [Sphingopyxis terrae subsp. ummariensis]|jgi:hypothetical protein|nr:hypothetical protein [Sphingopyxis terrae]
MARFGSLIGVGLAATMMIAAPSFAATTTAKPATTAVKPAAKPVKQAAAKPKAASQRVAAARPTGHMVKAKQANGKTVTYNCSLPGNKNKQACKG